MKTFLKYAGILVGVGLVVIIGLSVFIHFYLTEDRVKALLVPRAEEALGRPVHLDRIQVGLWRGITVENFTVQEKDGSGDFFRAKEFVLDYELLPLLDRRLIISRVILQKPFIHIERWKNGQFNFETLAFLTEKQPSEPKSSEKAAALPLALTVDQVAIEEAHIMIEDQLGEIPAVDSTGNVSISLESGTDLASLRYHGRYDLAADVSYGELAPHISGEGEFNQDNISYTIDTTMGEQQVQMAGSAQNWRQAPAVRLDVTSPRLDMDRLLALLGGVPAKTKGEPPAEGKSKKAPSEPIATSLPPGLTASGQISIKEALYRNMEMRDFTASYTLKEGILEIPELSARTAEGKIVADSRFDLTAPEPAYQGSVRLYSLQAQQLARLISEQFGPWLSGSLNSTVDFSGQGTDWEQLKRRLSAEGEYAIRDGQFKEVPITRALADLLNLPELRAISFQDLTGTVRLKDGNLLLNSLFSGRNLQAQATGTIGLDGQLNMPVALHLSGPLAQKLQSRTSLAKYLTNEKGGTTINLKLTGRVSKPRPTLDTAAAGKQLKEQVEKKVFKELDRFLQENQSGQDQKDPEQSPVQDLFKGLLGK